MRFACNTEFTGMAGPMGWASSLSRDRKWPRVTNWVSDAIAGTDKWRPPTPFAAVRIAMNATADWKLHYKICRKYRIGLHIIRHEKRYFRPPDYSRRRQREAVAFTFSARLDPERSWGRLQRTDHSLNKSGAARWWEDDPVICASLRIAIAQPRIVRFC